MPKYFYIALLIGWMLVGCMSVPAGSTIEPASPSGDHEKAENLLEKQKNKEAMELLTKLPGDAMTYFLLGKIHSISGDMEKAIEYLQKALQEKKDYHAAYLALENIHQFQLLQILEQVDLLQSQKKQAREEGKGNIKKAHQMLEQKQHEQTMIYIAQAKTYLLYSDMVSTIANFSTLEAHLRDMMDLFQERSRIPGQYKKHRKKQEDPIISQLAKTRRDITKKYIRTLFESGVKSAESGNISKAVDALKEADDHTAKFFVTEKNTSKVSYLGEDSEIIELGKEIVEYLARYYSELLHITLDNKAQFIDIGSWLEVEEQSHKIEEILQSWIQLRVNYLGKFEGLNRTQAEEHSQIIPLYHKFLQHLPESSKAGEYHYRLARYYNNQGDRTKTKKHAEEAQRLIGGYEIEKLLETLEGREETEEGETEE